MLVWFYYSIYLAVVILVILRVGHLLHKSGGVYCNRMINYNPRMAKSVNDLLLLGYYLLNIGYSVFILAFQMRPLENVSDLIELLSYKIGTIVFLLGVMHFCNMLGLYLVHVYHEKKFVHHKKLFEL